MTNKKKNIADCKQFPSSASRRRLKVLVKVETENVAEISWGFIFEVIYINQSNLHKHFSVYVYVLTNTIYILIKKRILYRVRVYEYNKAAANAVETCG